MLSHRDTMHVVEEIDAQIGALRLQLHSGAMQRIAEAGSSSPLRWLSLTVPERIAALARLHQSELTRLVERLRGDVARCVEIVESYPEHAYDDDGLLARMLACSSDGKEAQT